jgi:hypothetical protein
MHATLENRMKVALKFPRSVLKKNNKVEEGGVQDYEVRNNMKS